MGYKNMKLDRTYVKSNKKGIFGEKYKRYNDEG